jgi:hypothetical protein
LREPEPAQEDVQNNVAAALPPPDGLGENVEAGDGDLCDATPAADAPGGVNEGEPSEEEEDDKDEPLHPRRSGRGAARHNYAAVHRQGLAAYALDNDSPLTAQNLTALSAALAEETGADLFRDLTDSHVHTLVKALAISLSSNTPTHREATTGRAAKWRAPDKKELDSILQAGTYDWAILPKGKRSLPTHWVRRIKRDAQGLIDKLKSRVVVNGNLQREGIDFSETFASVGKAPTLRMLHVLVALLDLIVVAYNVDSAFLGADIDSEVYVNPPPGFVFPPGKEDQVWLLKKLLYGLKQSPRLWQDRLTSILNKIGFVQSKIDDGLFILCRGNDFAFHFLHVDVGKIVSNSSSLIADIRKQLEAALSIKWDNNPSFYLGVAVVWDKKAGTVKLHQSRYIDDTLSRFGMSKCATEPTPIAPKTVLEPGTAKDLAEGKDLPLGQLVGCLLYLACWTRPDISAAVSRVASFVSKPTPAAWTAGKQILRYLKKTRDVGIVYSRSSNPVQLEALFSFSSPVVASSPTKLLAYSDVDWATCLDTRRSTTGNVIMLANGPIDWLSCRQQTVATSTSQAEYQALAKTGGQIVFLCGLLSELGFPSSVPTILCGDNQASIAMSPPRIATLATSTSNITTSANSSPLVLSPSPTSRQGT